jgi:ketosteroid isomerase-like protein
VKTDPSIQIVARMFDAFTRRDLVTLLETVGPDMEFAAPTANIARDGAPYIGHDGMREYMADVTRVWRELRVIPQSFRAENDRVLATGRVYARDHQGSIIDSPAGWVFRVSDGQVVRGRAYERSEEAVAAFEGS